MSYRLELWLVVLVAAILGIVGWAATRGPDAVKRDARASTFLTGPDGSKALYDVLVRLGRRVARRRAPLFGFAAQSSGKRALLVVLDPPNDLEAAELEQVVTFVRGGGAVLAAGWGGGITRCAGWRLQPAGFEDDSVLVRPPGGEGALRLPLAARVLTPRQTSDRIEALRKRRLIEADDRCDMLVPRTRDTLVAASNGRPIVLQLRYGEAGGSIILAADVGWFRNRVWRETDIPYVVMPLLSQGARVTWDEYHHGFGTDGESVSALVAAWVRASPAGWVVVQLVAVGLIWLAVTAVRFGPAQSAIERRRRSPLEHLEALAAGLESAAGVDTAVQLMTLGLRRRLSRGGHLAPGTGHLSEWLEGLEIAVNSPRGRQAVRSLQHTITHPGGPERVLAAAHAVEDVWEELRPRTTRDAS